jgi:ribonuclease HII
MTRRIDPALIPPQPNLDFENSLWKEGITLIAGIDEAGRGALAGPVTAAVVILPQEQDILRLFSGILDSKKLTPQTREDQKLIIESHSKAWGVGYSSAQEIDQMGIAAATRISIHRALKKLELVPHHLLIDYLILPDHSVPQTRLTKGDARSLSIAAASILAKTHRDAWMISRSDQFPVYHFVRNKGYGTHQHRTALQTHGPCQLHRLTFSPLCEMTDIS